MKKFAFLVAVSGVAMLGSVFAGPVADPNAAEAKGIIKEFFATLKGELENAVAEGGPVNAISVCKERAPEIAREQSEKTGWEVGRTSLKLRNSKTNAPDAWEEKVMQGFEERKKAGEDVKTMAKAEVVETEKGKRFRFMKAIPTLEICLVCHGEAIGPDVAAALDEAYPDDQARGFKLGDIRGAFTLSKPVQ